ncbi:hypothetical protein ACFRQN_07375, partial [Kitasatospora sp. NPDC056800]
TTTRPLIPPALNSAAKIVHFLQLHGFDEEAVERPSPAAPKAWPKPRRAAGCAWSCPATSARPW